MYKLQPQAFYYDWKLFTSSNALDEEVIWDDLYDRVDWEGIRVAPTGKIRVLGEEDNVVSENSFDFDIEYASPADPELLSSEKHAALLIRVYIAETDPYCCTQIEHPFDPQLLRYEDGSLYYGDDYVQADGDSSIDFYFYFENGVPVGKTFNPEALKKFVSLHEVEEYIASSDLPRCIDTSALNSIAAATEVAIVLNGIVIDYLDELKECTENERSYKVRPDFGPSKFYLDWSKPEGRGGQMGYDSSVQSLISWILHDNGIADRALTSTELAEFKSKLAAEPDQLWIPSDGNRRDWLNEVYKYSIEYLAFVLDQNNLDIQSFIDFGQYQPGTTPAIQI